MIDWPAAEAGLRDWAFTHGYRIREMHRAIRGEHFPLACVWAKAEDDYGGTHLNAASLGYL